MVPFKRVVSFRKIECEIIKVSEDISVPDINIDLQPEDYLLDLMIWNDSLYLTNLFGQKLIIWFKWKAKSRYLYQKQPLLLDYAFNSKMSEIANRATEIFADLYFRPGNYVIKWEKEFTLFRADLNTYWNELSTTDRLVFNLSVIIATRELLIKKESLFNYLPIVIDDLLIHISEHQFSLETLLNILPDQQLLLLVHEYTLRKSSNNQDKIVPNYFFAKRDGASVQIEKIE